MKILRQASIGIALLLLCAAISSCTGGAVNGTGEAPLTADQKAAAAQKQGGPGGIKAKEGGGVMPDPIPPKPGEHVGAPDAGGKSSGG
jgi:hypothetical protein